MSITVDEALAQIEQVRLDYLGELEDGGELVDDIAAFVLASEFRRLRELLRVAREALHKKCSEKDAEIADLKRQLLADAVYHMPSDATLIKTEVLAELKKDAERYRWLRNKGKDSTEFNEPINLDEQVDIAIATEKGQDE